MRLEDFRIMKGNDSLEFVEFAEGPTKTRPVGLNAKPRQFSPKCFRPAERDVQLRCSVSKSAVSLAISGRVVHFISR